MDRPYTRKCQNMWETRTTWKVSATLANKIKNLSDKLCWLKEPNALPTKGKKPIPIIVVSRTHLDIEWRILH